MTTTQEQETQTAPSERQSTTARRSRRIRRAGLVGLAAAVGAVGLAACQPPDPVTGVYSVNVNGSIGEITVEQSGGGTAATYTATVSASFKPSGFSCSLTPGTVIASFAGTSPSFTERYAQFSPTTCAKNGDGFTSGSVANLNDDESLTLGLATSGPSAQASLLTRTADATWTGNPVTAGEYAVNVNGSVGSLSVHQSGAGDASVYTATVSTGFKPSGFTCSLTPGTVVASFTGAGPGFVERYAQFSPTSCAKNGDGFTSGSVAMLDIDNSIVLGLPSNSPSAQAALLTRTGAATVVANPVPQGEYAVNVNGSVGSLSVHQSGAGDASVYTATVSTGFKPSGFTCSLTPGTVVASFTGAGPSFVERYAQFSPTSCAKNGDGFTSGSVAMLETDNSIVLGLPSNSPSAQAALLTRTGPATVVTNPVAAGTYSLNINGSVGQVRVTQSGSGATAIYTVSVAASFAPSGFTCSLTPGTIVASFTGAGPSFIERYAEFSPTSCVKNGDGFTSGSVALLNADNSIVLGLASNSPSAQAALLDGRS